VIDTGPCRRWAGDGATALPIPFDLNHQSTPADHRLHLERS